MADAHRLGRKVAAHAHGAEGILLGLARRASTPSSTAPTSTMPASPTMKKNGTYLVPTLYLEDWLLENVEQAPRTAGV